ncbi:MAG: DNA recombination protein RmuC [Parahaliea sp.]
MDDASQQFLLTGLGLVAGMALIALAWLGYRLRRQGAGHRRLLSRYRQLQHQYAVLGERHRAAVQQHREQLELMRQQREQLRQEFENLANRIFEERNRQFTSTSRQSLEDLLRPFRDQIEGFRARVDQVHSESVRGQASLAGELRKVLDIGLQMNQQAGNLAAALKGDNKTAGNWGEAQLERSLELAGLQPGDHYQAQAPLRDEQGRRKVPDFIVKLPGGKHLVIDSKVSLVAYERAVSAEGEQARQAALDEHVRALRQHVDDLAGKAYAQLPGLGSPDFVLMFTPLEPAWIEAMRRSPELFNSACQKGVILVSHTTLMPVLRTVANLWMVDRGNREAREIALRAGEIYHQVCLVAERLNRLGNTLRSAGNHYNDTVRALAGQKGLQGKVERLRNFSHQASSDLPEMSPVHTDLEQERLGQGIRADTASPDATKP